MTDLNIATNTYIAEADSSSPVVIDSGSSRWPQITIKNASTSNSCFVSVGETPEIAAALCVFPTPSDSSPQPQSGKTVLPGVEDTYLKPLDARYAAVIFEGGGSGDVHITFGGPNGNINQNVPAEAPVAEFSADPLSGSDPLTVQFTNLSTGSLPMTYLWDFGDSNTSTERNPEHEYGDEGTYTVSLTCTNSAGESTETKTDYIEVTAP